ncbi:MAG: hypothetical protein DKINENOH_00309 [bacterium]|nr:hypothetical protein [bacterium]
MLIQQIWQSCVLGLVSLYDFISKQNLEGKLIQFAIRNDYPMMLACNEWGNWFHENLVKTSGAFEVFSF